MINDSGQITGFYVDANGVFHGFELSDGKYTTLDDPNAGSGAGQGTFLYGILNSGKVVGGSLDANNLYHGLLAIPSDDGSANLNTAASGVRPSSDASANVTIAKVFMASSLPPANPLALEAGISSENNSPGRNGNSASVLPASNLDSGQSGFASVGNLALVPAMAQSLRARDILFSTAFQSGVDPYAADLGLVP